MDNMRGALLMIVSMLGFAIEDAFIKTISASVPIGQVLIYLGLGGGLAFSVLSSRRGYCVWSRQFFHRTVIARNVAEIIGTASFITALTLIPLSLASALLQANPLFVTLGAIVFFGERVGWRRWLATIVGLIGVLIILRPGFDAFQPAAIFGLVGALGLAGRDLATRHRPPGVHPLQTSAWGFFMLVPVGIGMLWLSGGPVRLDGTQGLMILGAIVLGMAGYYALTLAVQLGDIGLVTPFRYVRLVFALIIGWAIFAERPDAPTLIGAAVVVASGIYTLAREARVAGAARRAARDRAAP